jgi:hypothetical protein
MPRDRIKMKRISRTIKIISPNKKTARITRIIRHKKSLKKGNKKT